MRMHANYKLIYTNIRMLTKQDIKKIKDYTYEIPRTFRQDMRVPARFYASDKLLEGILTDESLEQLVNSTTLPGIVKYALAMPEMHEGYGLPIGGIIATDLKDGVISPGGVGYDINCGVRLLASNTTLEEIRPYLKDLVHTFFQKIPAGVGVRGSIALSKEEMNQVLENGAKWVVSKGYGRKEDLECSEESGNIQNIDLNTVSERAKRRGEDQLGTLGSGNHFLEIQVVEQIFDPKVAEVFGLKKNQITILIHTGSRGLGHQVCTDYVRVMQEAQIKYKIRLPDQELACAPFNSPEGQKYFSAMCASANYAWANRQCLTHFTRLIWEKVLQGKIKNLDLRQVYDVAHNIAKIEEYNIDGQKKKLCVHRKGATRAFGPGYKEVPEIYRNVGQPVLIPGSMGTASYVLAGSEKAMQETFGSSCHGAGRLMSRTQAKRQIWGEKLQKELLAQGIIVESKSKPGLAEEAPSAYKDVDDVVKVVDEVGIAKKVARMKPLGVIKG